MKVALCWVLSTTVLFALRLFPPLKTDRPLVEVGNISDTNGCIRLAVFGSAEDFNANRNPVTTSVLRPRAAQQPLFFELPHLPSGKYAVAIFHDRNDNGELDRNLIGIPKEPYAFSREPSSKWRAPDWGEIAVDTPELKRLKLELRTWKER